jgi:hypothetical protein
MKIMNGLVSSLSNREKRLRVALFVLPALVVVLALLLGGALDTDATPKVHVSIAPVDGAALPAGASALVSTPTVADGERDIAPARGTDKDFLYGMLTSNNHEVTILEATATADIASATTETANIASTTPETTDRASVTDNIGTTPAPDDATAGIAHDGRQTTAPSAATAAYSAPDGDLKDARTNGKFSLGGGILEI